jgi:hypothetical protein
MSTVFFLFLLHLSLGVLATLPFVPEKAGRSFFKFSSAAAVFMSTAALWLVYRRYGLAGVGAPGGPHFRTLLVLAACCSPSSTTARGTSAGGAPTRRCWPVRSPAARAPSWWVPRTVRAAW